MKEVTYRNYVEKEGEDILFSQMDEEEKRKAAERVLEKIMEGLGFERKLEEKEQQGNEKSNERKE